ncbi:MAG: prepilin-type N-terminal cleavage/methylation domain-containing protein [Deltaproteobacteria bacterium]|nr:prepilin-type N-terminal cleavage/methylation domain-containing protein [Deltaproteobacteria bacterium]
MNTFENNGFTLLEVIVALTVMLIVMSGIISLLNSLNRTYTGQNVAAAVQQVTRAGIDIMTRHIRMAGLNPLNLEPIGIVEASADKIRFNLDLDGSGAIEAGAGIREDIAYLLNRKSQLIRQYDGNNRSNRSLLDNVSELKFKYLGADNQETSNLDAIRTVEISLTVKESSGRGQFMSRTYSTRVICRNLGLH